MAWHGMVWDGMHFVVGTLVGRAGRRPPPKSFCSRLSYSVQGCDYFVHLSIFASLASEMASISCHRVASGVVKCLTG